MQQVTQKVAGSAMKYDFLRFKPGSRRKDPKDYMLKS